MPSWKLKQPLHTNIQYPPVFRDPSQLKLISYEWWVNANLERFLQKLITRHYTIQISPLFSPTYITYNFAIPSRFICPSIYIYTHPIRIVPTAILQIIIVILLHVHWIVYTMRLANERHIFSWYCDGSWIAAILVHYIYVYLIFITKYNIYFYFKNNISLLQLNALTVRFFVMHYILIKNVFSVFPIISETLQFKNVYSGCLRQNIYGKSR